MKFFKWQQHIGIGYIHIYVVIDYIDSFILYNYHAKQCRTIIYIELTTNGMRFLFSV